MEGNAKQEKDLAVTKEALRLTAEMLSIFSDFITDYVAEYKTQFSEFPEVYYLLKLDVIDALKEDPTTTPKTNPIDNTNNQNNSSTNTKNTNNNNNLTGSTNSNIVIILLIVFVFLLLLRKKQTPKKRKK